MIDFEELYHDAYFSVRDHIFYHFGWCLSFEDAEDVAQTAFLKAMQSEHRGAAKPKTWLTKIAVNYAIDEYVRKPARQYNNLHKVAQRDGVDWEPDADTRIIYETTLDKLLPRHQELIRGIDELGYSSRDIAAQTGRTANGTKTSLYRARMNFRRYANNTR